MRNAISFAKLGWTIVVTTNSAFVVRTQIEIKKSKFLYHLQCADGAIELIDGSKPLPVKKKLSDI